MQSKKLVFVAAAVALLALAACRPITREGATAGGSSDLAGTSWVLAELNGQPPVEGTLVTLQFATDGRAGGSDGCNRYGVGYTISGNNLTFAAGSGVATLMACPEPIMQQAKSYNEALAATATFSMDGGRLTLLDASGNAIAVFDAQSNSIAGTAWEATMINNGKQAVVSVVAGTKPTALFDPEGNLGGSGGCNNIMGQYTLAANNGIQIGPVASSRKLCPEPAGVMEQEAAYIKALESAATYRMEGDRLELRTADGALAVQFRKLAEPAMQEGAKESDMAAVTGTVTYLVRRALPPDAQVEVTIRNAQLADAPPEMTLLATVSFPSAGQQVPIPFTVPYDPTKVQQGALYSIGARITDAAGKLLFISTTATPVITNGNPTENVEIMLSPVQ